MKQILVAVCDDDEEYLNRFAAYFRNHDIEDIVIHTFTKLEAFMQGLLTNKFQLILLGHGFEAAKEGLFPYEISILYLEEEVKPEVDTENLVAEQQTYGKQEKKSILKYQSAEAILHEMYFMCDQNEAGVSQRDNALQGKLEVIGIYSPVQHEMQVPFSMTLASFLAERKKVLYLNLMECTGMLEIFRLEGEQNLGDLLAKLHQNRLTEEGLRQVIYQSGELYYVPPAGNPENIYQLGVEEYRHLLGFLESNTDFEAVVIDFGSMITGFSKLLNCCHEVYCLMKAGPFYECQKTQFLKYLEAADQEILLDKIQTVYLPYSASQVVPTGGLLEQFKWSELGDLVRQYLFGAVTNDS